MKSARTIHDVRVLALCIRRQALSVEQLNKELGELESLIESKVSVIRSALKGTQADQRARSTARTNWSGKSSG